MKRTGVMFTLLLLLLPMLVLAQARDSGKSDQKPEKVKTAVFSVKGMSCAACSGFVTGACEKVEGVVECKVNFKEGRAEVQYDPSKTSREEIEKALKTTGFAIAAIQPDKTAAESTDEGNKKPSKKTGDQ